MARPTKLTAETQARIVEALENGATRNDAAWVGGITYVTFNNWMGRGEAAKRGIYREFREAVEAAEALARYRHTLVITKAAKDGDWRASEAFLKRRDPEHWGDKSQHDITTKGEAIVLKWPEDMSN